MSTVLLETVTAHLHALGEEQADGLLLAVDAWSEQPVMNKEHGQHHETAIREIEMVLQKESFVTDAVLACINPRHENRPPNDCMIHTINTTTM